MPLKPKCSVRRPPDCCRLVAGEIREGDNANAYESLVESIPRGEAVRQTKVVDRVPNLLRDELLPFSTAC